MNVKDRFGKNIKRGDDVIFCHNNFMQKGTILDLFYKTEHKIGEYGLSFIEKVLLDEEALKNNNISCHVFAYIGWNGSFDTDHYGKPIEGTFNYKCKTEEFVYNIIKLE